MRSDHHSGRTWGKKGETPVVETTGARHGMSLISAITSRGHMRFMIKEKGGVNAAVFIEFLKRMIIGAKRAIFLIVDRGPAHIAKKARTFVESLNGRLRLFYLPPYSPTAIQMNWSGNTSRPTLLAAWRSPTRSISRPRSAHPCANCRTTRKKSDLSTKNHRSNMPRESAFTYGSINTVPSRMSRTIGSCANERAFQASQSLFTLRQTRLTVSLPTAPPNRARSARRTRRVLVPER